MEKFLRKNRRLFAILVAFSFVLSTIIPDDFKIVYASDIDGATVTDADQTATDNDAVPVSADEVKGESASDADNKTDESDDAESDDDLTEDGALDEAIDSDAVSSDKETGLSVYLPESECRISIDASPESLPYPEEELTLTARELKEGSIEYYSYLSQAAEAIGENDTDSISFARFFDIEILHNGQKVEPVSPVEVKIEYDDKLQFSDESDVSIVHFADNGTEVIDDVDINAASTEITYEQDSFSVTATIVTGDDVPTEKRADEYESDYDFVLLAYCDNKYYSVQNDGTLIEIAASKIDASNPDAIVITEDNSFVWKYHFDHFNNTYIRYNADGFNYNENQLATAYAYTFIAPNENAGIMTSTPAHNEDENRTLIKDNDDHVIYIDDIRPDHSPIVFSNNEIKTGDKYLTLNADRTKIQGNSTAGDTDGVKFYFAKSSLTYDNLPDNHAVNHIDIAISDVIDADIPLAYGIYYNKKGDPVLTVDPVKDAGGVNIHISQEVSVSQGQLRKAKITANKKNPDGTAGDPLDDAFYINGYTANAETDFSKPQVRIEGVFKVAYDISYSGTKEVVDDSNPENTVVVHANDDHDIWAERIAHTILYTVEATEPKAKFYYTNPNYNPDRDPDEYLYDSDGNILFTESDVTVKASFDYFDNDPVTGNRCPALIDSKYYWGQNLSVDWPKGRIHGYNISGMDFILDGETEINLRPVAIEIDAAFIDKKGNPIYPAEPITGLKYGIYVDEDGEYDQIDNLNVGRYDHDPDYTGYEKLKYKYIDTEEDSNSGLVYDYEVPESMVYVTEDKTTVPNKFVDKDGNVWIYSHSYIQTEYVRRSTADPYQDDHFSKNYDKSSDDKEYKGIPEILGDRGQEKFNSFLEFHVKNVYEMANPTKEETSPYEGDGTLGAVNPGDTITYKITYTNYNDDPCDVTISDKLDDNVEFVTATEGGECSAAEGTPGGTVTWNLEDVPALETGYVELTVKVLDSALKSEGGPGKVVNGGDSATVRIGNDDEFKLETVENPVVKKPHKKETSPYDGIGKLGPVTPGQTIDYVITYSNYLDNPADITITDKLDDNVKFVFAEPLGYDYDEGTHTITWTDHQVPADAERDVHITVRVLDSALESEGGPGKVVNGGESATVKVGDDPAYALDEVENPVVTPKKEISPYEGTGTLGGVDVDDEITYEISYKNYKDEAADVVIIDALDPNVEFVIASNDGEYDAQTHTVTWTLEGVGAGDDGTVTLTVKVLESALRTATPTPGPGKVVNGGTESSIQVGNDPAYKLNVVENPVPKTSDKTEIEPYTGKGELGGVKVGQEITYKLTYENYLEDATTIIITDKLDDNVKFIRASNDGACTSTTGGGTVTWNLENVQPGHSDDNYVTVTVEVLASALESENGPGEVVNGGESSTVKVGDDPAYSLDLVKNPVPEPPVKQETAPYEGTGTLGAVKVDDEITYQISYNNYKTEKATVTIVDELDENVEFVSASNEGEYVYDKDTHTITWTLVDCLAGKKDVVTLTVKVLDSARTEATPAGPGKVVNGGDETAYVQVDNDTRLYLEAVENPVPEKPTKQETYPDEGNGELKAVRPGEKITYEITCKNYKDEDSTIVITDKLDKNVSFVDASDMDYCEYYGDSHTVRWALQDIAPDEEVTVSVTVEVLESALKSEGGPGYVINNGDTATVKVGNDNEYKLDTVTNPVPDDPVKKEITPYEGTGMLGAVEVGDEITYEISYENYKSIEADVTIIDGLDKNVEYVSSSDNGEYNEDTHTVTWNFEGCLPGKKDVVTLTVKVLESALESNDGPGFVYNGGDFATVQVGQDEEFYLDIVENPVPEKPVKREILPYEGNGVLGAVDVGESISYEISYMNYKEAPADVVIKDKLDSGVEFVSASVGGVYDAATHTVTWTLEDVESGKEDTVVLTVKVLEDALESEGGSGKVVNGGDTATVKVGNDKEFTLDVVENPVNEPEKPEEEKPVPPHKKELSPYDGNGVLGSVNVGDEIVYEISYKNYKLTEADVVITDKLDANVIYVSASDGGVYDASTHTVKWTFTDTKSLEEGKVKLTVRVAEGALKSKGGPGKVVNGGGTATVKIGNDEYVLELVENPVDEPMDSKETTEPDNDKGTDSSKKDVPKQTTVVRTEDSAPVMPIMMIMIISLMCIAGIICLKRRRR